MQKLVIEIDGDDSADIDEATSQLISELKAADVEVSPENAGRVRDGGVILLSIAILGGAASVAQIASTIHTLTQKKTVQIIVVAPDGRRLPVVEGPAEVTKMIESAIARE